MVALAWERFAAADTLVYVDLPVLTHYRFVTKRLLKGLFGNPPGWPENSPVWSSTLDSYRVIRRCHRSLTPKYRQLVAEASASKRVHHLKSPGEMQHFSRRSAKSIRVYECRRHMKIAAYQAPLLPAGSMDAVALIRGARHMV